MARDRYNNRSSYDSTFKYGSSDSNKGTFRTVTSKQSDLIKKMYMSNKISDWDRDFLKSISASHNFSDKQKKMLNKIYLKTK